MSTTAEDNTRRAIGWLTVEEVSAITGYALNTLRTMRSRGRGPAYYKAGGIRYHIDDVQEFLAGTRVPCEGRAIATPISVPDFTHSDGLAEAEVVEEDNQEEPIVDFLSDDEDLG